MDPAEDISTTNLILIWLIFARTELSSWVFQLQERKHYGETMRLKSKDFWTKSTQESIGFSTAASIFMNLKDLKHVWATITGKITMRRRFIFCLAWLTRWTNGCFRISKMSSSYTAIPAKAGLEPPAFPCCYTPAFMIILLIALNFLGPGDLLMKIRPESASLAKCDFWTIFRRSTKA